MDAMDAVLRTIGKQAPHGASKRRMARMVRSEDITMQRLADVAREGMRHRHSAFDPGDTVRVMVRVREGDKERLQAFEGLVIAKRGGGISENFTVRKVSAGVGVERLFPIHSRGDRVGRCRAPGPCSPREAVLSAPVERKSRPYSGKARELVPWRCAPLGRRSPANGQPWAEEHLLVGVDEAGRGPLAGPVVAAAVVFFPGHAVAGIAGQ